MKVLFDASVLVPALLPSHPMHGQAYPSLERALRGQLQIVLAAHTLAETYAVLSTLPVHPRIGPDQARHLVRQVTRAAQVVSLSAADYLGVLDAVAERGLTGGVIYDALLVQAAKKARADRLLTLDRTDFLRLWPEGESKIVSP